MRIVVSKTDGVRETLGVNVTLSQVLLAAAGLVFLAMGTLHGLRRRRFPGRSSANA